MNRHLTHNTTKKFRLEKWFLDMVTDEGEALIFYAAKLYWNGITLPYTSMLRYSPLTGGSQTSRFHHVHYPEINNDLICFHDPSFRISGIWQSNAATIDACLFDSAEGSLHWKCFQPSADVELVANGKWLHGKGYAEKLVLTTVPWAIPMQQLRWGRYVCSSGHLVWIELNGEPCRQWLWHNGELQTQARISDNEISIPSSNTHLHFSDKGTIESENKIGRVAKQVARYIPGFSNSVPLNFLMADEHKWRSLGTLSKNNIPCDKGWVIHELVDFSKAKNVQQ